MVKKHSEFISYPIYLWTEKQLKRRSVMMRMRTKQRKKLKAKLKKLMKRRRRTVKRRRRSRKCLTSGNSSTSRNQSG